MGNKETTMYSANCRVADPDLLNLRTFPIDSVYRTVMERLKHVCHAEERKVLVTIDRLNFCKVGFKG